MATNESPNLPARSGDAFIVASGLLSVLGWTLALTGCLTFLPYLCGLVVVAGVTAWSGRAGFRWVPRKSLRRLRRPIVAVYTIVWASAAIGGAVYAPSNYDALSYRIPQLLHWIAEGGWHWIDAANSRMNIAPPGMNWLVAPLYFLTTSDRLWFLVNLAAFSFLPGYLFEMFRRAGAAPRIAWWFMWLIPCGYSFALQAGSIGNDLLATMYATAGIAIALRARSSGNPSDVGISIIAIAMATGVKSIYIPLLLPWIIAIAPAIRHGLRRPVLSLGAIAIAAFSSCLPTTILNIRTMGHWTGDPKDEHLVQPRSTVVGIVSNSVMLAVSNTQPPALPNPSAWNLIFENWLRKTGLESVCRQAPRFELRWNELPTEELASVGPGVLVASGLLILGIIRRGGNPTRRLERPVAWGVALVGWLAFLVVLARFSSEAIGRLSTAFVPVLLFPLLLRARGVPVLRSRAAGIIAALSAALCLPGLALSPARPLIPVNRLLGLEGSNRLGRIATVYRTYAQRADCYEPLLLKLDPADRRELWFAGGGDDPEAPVWKPYGGRTVRQWIRLEPASRSRLALISELGVRERFGLSFDDFMNVTGGRELARADLSVRASRGLETWYLVECDPAAARQ